MQQVPNEEPRPGASYAGLNPTKVIHPAAPIDMLMLSWGDGEGRREVGGGQKRTEGGGGRKEEGRERGWRDRVWREGEVGRRDGDEGARSRKDTKM